MSGLEFIDWEEDTSSDIPEYDVDPVEKTISIFDILKALTETKKILDFDKLSVRKGYSQFMINRWLSMNEFTLMFVEDINTLQNISDEQHFTILHSLIPQRRFYYEYAKHSKNLSNTDHQYIADYFQIGIRDAENYTRVMTDEDINGILDKYRYGKNGKQTIDV